MLLNKSKNLLFRSRKFFASGFKQTKVNTDKEGVYVTNTQEGNHITH